MFEGPESEPHCRLLNAAERLFGEHGLQSSIRDITAAARVNLASVNYHFRNKEGLVAAVLQRRAGPINAERIRLLDAFEAEFKNGSEHVERILYAFVGPTIPLMEDHPEFLRFAGRLFSDPDPKVRQVLMAQFGAVARRFHAALCRALPQLSPGEVSLRIGYFAGAVLYAWTNQMEMMRMFGVPPAASGSRELMEQLVHYGAAGMRAESHSKGYLG